MRRVAGQEKFKFGTRLKSGPDLFNHDFEKKRFARSGVRCLKEKYG
jgi:hypothetical protein